MKGAARLAKERLLRALERYTVREVIVRGARLVRRSVFPQVHVIYRWKETPTEWRGPCISLIEVLPNETLDASIRQSIAVEEGTAHTEDILKRPARGDRLFLMYHEDDLVGYCSVRSGVAIKKWYQPLRAEDLVIYGVGVIPSKRGRGYAPASYVSICERFGHSADVYLDVVRDNFPALRAAEKSGFVKLGEARLRRYKFSYDDSGAERNHE